MDLLGDLGTQDQLTSVRAENAVLQEKVKELSLRVRTLTVENESLKSEVETYRREMALPNNASQDDGGNGGTTQEIETRDATADDFVRSGNSVYPKQNHVTLPELHGPSNNLCCALSPDDVVLANGGADATLRLVPWGAATDDDDTAIKVVQQAASIACAAPVISVAFSPVLRGVLAVGCMDGSTSLVHYQSVSASSQPLQTTVTTLPKKHVKYVRNVVWSPKEAVFASSSADGNIFLYKVEARTEFQSPFRDDAGDDQVTVTLRATLLESLHLTGAIESMCFGGENKLYCYVRDTPHLTCFDLDNDMKQTKLHLNNNQGTAGGFSDHVSFAILDLHPSRHNNESKYLAAATDTSRNLVIESSTGRIVRSLYGHQNDGFSQPKISWSASGQYLIGNTQDDSVLYVWDVASGQIVERLEGHSSPVRDIAAGNATDMLVTTAFDKSTRLWFTE